MLKGEGKEYSSGWSMEVDLNGGNGGNVYNDEIKGCPTWVPTVGLFDPTIACNDVPDTNPEKGCLNVKTGVKQGPTKTASISSLRRIRAYWDTATNAVAGGCTAAGNCEAINPFGIPVSPRVVPVALFDPQAYLRQAATTATTGWRGSWNCSASSLRACAMRSSASPPAWCGTGEDPAKTVVGRLMNFPGQFCGASGSAGPESFLVITRLSPLNTGPWKR